MAKKKISFEDSIKRLEEIVSLMENNETPLEKSVELYKEGVEISLYCADVIKNAQEQISVLQKTSEGIFQETPVDLPNIKFGIEE